MPCLVGGLLGVVMAKFFGKKQIAYFLPFILSIIVYLGVTILGLGLISIEEILWIAHFFHEYYLCNAKQNY